MNQGLRYLAPVVRVPVRYYCSTCTGPATEDNCTGSTAVVVRVINLVT
eukprot:SAG22_NODE_3778_length_1533_cov_1.101116_1_plen_47_part_10